MTRPKARIQEAVRAGSRDEAIDACRVLNSFIGDLVMGVRGIDIYKLPRLAPFVEPVVLNSVRRMHLSYLIITLSKFDEWFRRYHHLIPSPLHGPARDVRRRISATGIVQFRNKVVGHVLDKPSNRPLARADIDARFAKIVGDSEEDFLRWINDANANEPGRTVVGTVEAIMVRISEVFDVNPEDILK